jgi:NAD(P) transhydrogenase
MEKGRIAACHAFGLPMPPAPQFFPYGIYAVPEISTVGMSEEEVRSNGVACEWASRASARPPAATSWG